MIYILCNFVSLLAPYMDITLHRSKGMYRVVHPVELISLCVFDHRSMFVLKMK